MSTIDLIIGIILNQTFEYKVYKYEHMWRMKTFEIIAGKQQII